MGYVYLIGDWEKEGIYKIGVTRGKIEDRIKKLQTGNSGEIYLVSYFETDKPFIIEDMLHKIFFKQNVKNEWFELDIDNVTHFKDICQKQQDNLDLLKDNYFFNKKK